MVMRLRRVLVTAIIFVLLVLAVSIVLDKAMPKVVSFSPENNAFDQRQQTDLVWEFSHQMNQRSVERAIEILPEINGEFNWDENTLTFTPSENWEMGETVVVTFQIGAVSSLDRPLVLPEDNQFEIRHTLLAYLFDHNGATDIYALGIAGDLPRKLTDSGMVTGYSVATTGNEIYYSAGNEFFGSDLYNYMRFEKLSTIILSCENSLCENPSISPSGNHLAFTRTNEKGIAELWIRSLGTESNSRISEPGHAIRNLLWTSRGKLSFYDTDTQDFILVGSDGVELSRFPNSTGEVGSWSPDGNTFVAPFLFTKESDIFLGPTGEAAFDDIEYEDLTKVNLLSSHLFAYQDDEEPINLSKELWAEDLHPAYSPNGRWLIFARRFNDNFRWIPGRQMVLMPVDGGQVIPFTDDEQFKYADFAWHPNDDIIAAMRFNALVFTDPPEIWMFDLVGHGTRLIIGGYNPQWIP